MGAPTSLCEFWSSGETSLGGWLSIPSSVSAESVARAGLDYVCIDMQHGAVGFTDTIGMIQAVLLGGSRPIVRVPWNEPGVIGKVLDAGASGVIVPMVNTPDDAHAVVRACRYAPHGGTRSWGPGLAAPRIDGHYLDWAERNIAVIPMIETSEALANLDSILAVDGIDAIYVGPADLSLTLGLRPQNNDGDAAFDGALGRIVEACDAAGVVPGIHASGALAATRRSAGFRMITIATDSVAMRAGIEREVALAAGDEPAADGDAPY